MDQTEPLGFRLKPLTSWCRPGGSRRIHCPFFANPSSRSHRLTNQSIDLDGKSDHTAEQNRCRPINGFARDVTPLPPHQLVDVVGIVDVNFSPSNECPDARKEASVRLRTAAGKGDATTVEAEMLNGADVNFCRPQQETGRTALHVGCSGMHLDVVEALLRAKDINVNLKDSNGATALWLACAANRTSLTKRYFNCKTNPKDARQALIEGLRGNEVSPNQLKIVKLLLKRADVEVGLGDQFGCTPFGYVLEKGYASFLRLFLRRLNFEEVVIGPFEAFEVSAVLLRECPGGKCRGKRRYWRRRSRAPLTA